MIGKDKQIDYERVKIFDQFDFYFDQIIQKHNTASSICGYIVMAITKYICERKFQSMQNLINALEKSKLKLYIEDAMIWLQAKRKEYVNKAALKGKDQINYMKDWVANYEIEDFISYFSKDYINKNVFFFRQVSYDHPEQVSKVANEEAQRILFEKTFKGQSYFVTKFNELKHLKLEEWRAFLTTLDRSLPIVIITDLLGHFTTMIYFQGRLVMADTTDNQYMFRDTSLKVCQIVNSAMLNDI